jgi:hypothetical protein
MDPTSTGVTLPNEIWKRIMGHNQTLQDWVRHRLINRQVKNVLDRFCFGTITSLSILANAHVSWEYFHIIQLQTESPLNKSTVKVKLLYAREALRFIWNRSRTLRKLALTGDDPDQFTQKFIETSPNPTSFYWIAKKVLSLTKKFPKETIRELHFCPFASLLYQTQANWDQLQTSLQIVANLTSQLKIIHLQLDTSHTCAWAQVWKIASIEQYTLYLGPPPPLNEERRSGRRYNPPKQEMEHVAEVIAYLNKPCTKLWIELDLTTLQIPGYSRYDPQLSMGITEQLSRMVPVPHFTFECPLPIREHPQFMGNTMFHGDVTRYGSTPFQANLQSLTYGPRAGHREEWPLVSDPYLYVWPPVGSFPKLQNLYGIILDENLLVSVVTIMANDSYVKHHRVIPTIMGIINCRSQVDYPEECKEAQQFLQAYKKHLTTPNRPRNNRARRTNPRQSWLRSLSKNMDIEEDMDTDYMWRITFSCKCKWKPTHHLQVAIQLQESIHNRY